ncbi:MAG: class II aldolase/adducin family protein [Bacillota bacterium]
MNEGNIKFNCRWIKTAPLPFQQFSQLNEWRNKLFQLNLIGAYPNQLGYGNISVRDGVNNNFWITGSGTGGLAVLGEEHYTLVTDFDFERNSLTCSGPIKASSESLTHAAIYLSCPEANAVIHSHHPETWRKLLNIVPTTSPAAAYGTPEMAAEIIRLFAETGVADSRFLVMGGHEEGIIAFGPDLDAAGGVLLANLK